MRWGSCEKKTRHCAGVLPWLLRVFVFQNEMAALSSLWDDKLWEIIWRAGFISCSLFKAFAINSMKLLVGIFSLPESNSPKAWTATDHQWIMSSHAFWEFKKKLQFRCALSQPPAVQCIISDIILKVAHKPTKKNLQKRAIDNYEHFETSDKVE